jgi:hypothetical protein
MTTFTASAADIPCRPKHGGTQTGLETMPANGRVSLGWAHGYRTGDAGSPDDLLEKPALRAVPARSGAGAGEIDSRLRARGLEIVEGIDPDDAFNTPLALTDLAAVVMEMWESATASSEHHQDLLAILENGVRQAANAGCVSGGQLAAFREALTDLRQSRLVSENVGVVREKFIVEGFGPFGFLDESRGAGGTG